MDEAEVAEVIQLVERQKKRLHFASSLIHIQPASKELRQLPLFQGLADADFAKVRVSIQPSLHLFSSIASITLSSALLTLLGLTSRLQFLLIFRAA